MDFNHGAQNTTSTNALASFQEVRNRAGDVMPWNDYIFIGTYSGF